MANQSTPSPSYMVYYEETGGKHLELSNWAKRRLMGDPPYTERLQRWAVEKSAAIKKIAIAIALGFSYTRANNK